MAAIRTEGLTKHYGRVRALADLALEVREGEVFGFLGPNGAGKTTTIRLLMGLLQPTAGAALVAGHHAWNDNVEAHRDIGYLPSDPVFPRGLTGREFLRHLGSLRGGVADARIRHLADRFELDLSRPIQALSRGNRQKVGIVQALMHEPPVLIMDEPSSGLDPLKQATLNRLIRETVDTGRTVFLSSHVIAEVEEIADRVGIVRDGRLVALEGIDVLKSRAVRRVEIRFGQDVPQEPFRALHGVDDIEVRDRRLRLTVTGSMDDLVKTAARFEVETFTSHEADLADVFLAYYEDADTEEDA